MSSRIPTIWDRGPLRADLRDDCCASLRPRRRGPRPNDCGYRRWAFRFRPADLFAAEVGEGKIAYFERQTFFGHDRHCEVSLWMVLKSRFTKGGLVGREPTSEYAAGLLWRPVLLTNGQRFRRNMALRTPGIADLIKDGGGGRGFIEHVEMQARDIG